MSVNEWSRFILRTPINASRSAIFNAWTSQSGLESWFLRSSPFTDKNGRQKTADEKVSQGDQYRWRWHGYPDEVEEKGTILQMKDEEIFQFSFGKAGNVQITIQEVAGHNLLILEQTEIPEDENSKFNYHIGCSRGWLFYLTNLKSLLEGGIDLRNRSVELGEVINS